MIKETVDINLINTFLKEFNTAIKEINAYSKFLVYVIDDEIVGFLNFELIYERAEIDYIFVKDIYRKNQIGSKLLDKMYSILNENACKTITLEVRKSNDVAINFYGKNGFKKVSIRKKYYKDEDGILMLKEML